MLIVNVNQILNLLLPGSFYSVLVNQRLPFEAGEGEGNVKKQGRGLVERARQSKMIIVGGLPLSEYLAS